jgi:GDP/UDP-N,N'-diacetylbacillosamine 2-epimerase (hydrolysing)
MTRRICFVTGTRAEFGLLRLVMEEVKKTDALKLQVIVTGAHLSPEFGLTYQEVEQAGFAADCKVEMLLSSDTAIGVSKSMGLAVMGLADAYHQLRPDLVVVLGDRYEIFAAAAAACVAGIPLAHLHGGETTEGAIDEAFRHAITKMSHLHFVAAEDYRRRVVQLGEHPDRVFTVGGLGIDAIRRTSLMDRAALEASLDFELGRKSVLVTFHPVTLEGNESAAQMRELLAALDRLPDTQLVLTMPNADTGSRELATLVEDFVATHANARVYASLGQRRYLSCLKWVDAVVGNSSSGIAEAPSLHTATVNIGDRQRGRLRASSVIDCAPERGAILDALGTAFSPEFRQSLPGAVSPYGDGGASGRIVRVLEAHPLDGILKKAFYNLDQAPGAASGATKATP